MDRYKGFYFAGDGCYRDKDGYYWITGRVDDVLNVSGHRLGTAEIESALVSHESCAEAAVIGIPHEIKGEGIFAYAMLRAGFEPSKELVGELRQQVRKAIVFYPSFTHFSPSLAHFYRLDARNPGSTAKSPGENGKKSEKIVENRGN